MAALLDANRPLVVFRYEFMARTATKIVAKIQSTVLIIDATIFEDNAKTLKKPRKLRFSSDFVIFCSICTMIAVPFRRPGVFSPL